MHDLPPKHSGALVSPSPSPWERPRSMAPLLRMSLLAISALVVSCGDGSDPGAGSPAEPDNRAPAVEPVETSTGKNVPVELTLEASDPDGDDLTLRVVEEPENGEITERDEGSGSLVVRYAPSRGFVGSDEFVYAASDGVSESTAAVTVAVENLEPEALPVTTRRNAEGAPVTLELAGRDPNGDTLSFEIVERPTNGALGEIRIVAVEPASTASSVWAATSASTSAGAAEAGVEEDGVAAVTRAEVDYTPDPGASEPDQFAYTVTDGDLEDETGAEVQIAVNGPPEVPDVVASTGRDEPVEILLTGTDPDGDALAFEIVEEPISGTVSEPVGEDGGSALVEYTPAGGFAGEDRFRVRATDGIDAAEATVTVEVARWRCLSR